MDYIETLPITKWFLENYDSWHNDKFPGHGKIQYDNVLRSTHDFLNTNVHPNVGARASAAEPGLYLTDHGPEHIKMVMNRAQVLVATSKWGTSRQLPYECSIEPYDVFLLLMAVHFHDVGNMYGRDGHERRIADEMKKIPAIQLLDKFEQGLIAKIAACHGGKIDGDKDTISRLEEKNHFGDIEYHPQLVAACLRLADELAEERSRADGYALSSPGGIPATAQIFHKYAAALAGVDIDVASQRISLRFQITKADAAAQFPYKSGSIYLLDYIYERVLKTYKELIYCSQFMRRIHCRFSEVSVVISALCEEMSSQPISTIAFRVGDIGYPDAMGDLKSLAKGFAGAPDGNKLAVEMESKCIMSKTGDQ